MASSFTITAGRVFLISAPIVGSKLTSQISPLRIEFLAVEARKDSQFATRRIVWQQCLRCFCKLLLSVYQDPFRLRLKVFANQTQCGLNDLETFQKRKFLEFCQYFYLCH